jgi:sialate O-acetylesterase
LLEKFPVRLDEAFLSPFEKDPTVVKTMRLVLFLLGCCTFGSAFNVSSVFADNMVLQRDVKSAIYGFAKPQDKVTVSLGDAKKYSATASSAVTWKVLLEPEPAGGNFTITVSSDTENAGITLTGVTFG